MLLWVLVITKSEKNYTYKNLFTKAISEMGYQLSNDGENTWSDSLESIIDVNDTLYVLPQEMVRLDYG